MGDFQENSLAKSNTAMTHWLDDQNSTIQKDSLSEVGEFFQNLTSWSKERAESQRQLDSLVSLYNCSFYKCINGLIEEVGDLKAKHSAIVKERDNLHKTVIKQSNEIGQLKAKLPTVQILPDAEENPEQETQGADSQNSHIPKEEHHDNEEHVEKRNDKVSCQVSSFEETMENEKKNPINTQNNLDLSLFNMSSDGNVKHKKDVFMKDEITKEQPILDKETDKNFKCDRCPYETTLKGHLVRHISRHKSHFCDQCPYTATAKPKLKEHMKEVHFRSSEEKQFQCEQCPFKSKQKRALITHVKKIHLGKKHKFECEQCPFQANQKESLLTHIVLVHGMIKNHVCEECGHAAPQKADLDHHMNSVHKRGANITYNQWGDKSFMCKQCPREFSLNGNLIRHVIKVHQGKDKKP